MNFVRLSIAICALFEILGQEATNKMDSSIEKALKSSGPEYFKAEQTYRSTLGLEPVPESAIATSDPLPALILRVLNQWKQPEAIDFDRAIQHLDTVAAWLAPTPVPNPSPSGVAAYLTKHFESRVADLLAVHLIKQTDWPYWRVSGVLLYLREHARPSFTAALIRFLSKTNDQAWLAVALETIRAANDPALQSKIDAEERYLNAENAPVPPALKELSKP